MTFSILTVTRDKDRLFPDELFIDSEIYSIGIEQYCKEINVSPIYIDRNIAIFSDHYLVILPEGDYSSGELASTPTQSE